MYPSFMGTGLIWFPGIIIQNEKVDLIIYISCCFLQIAIARVECQTESGYSVLVTVIPVPQGDNEQDDEEEGHHDNKGSKKRKKMDKFIEGMKKKIKKGKTAYVSSTER